MTIPLTRGLINFVAQGGSPLLRPSLPSVCCESLPRDPTTSLRNHAIGLRPVGDTGTISSAKYIERQVIKDLTGKGCTIVVDESNMYNLRGLIGLDTRFELPKFVSSPVQGMERFFSPG